MYDTVIRRTWIIAAGRNFAFHIAVKSLQIETWLVYWKFTKTRHRPI